MSGLRNEALPTVAAHMREHHGPEHERHAMWSALADLLDHTAEACGLNKTPYVAANHHKVHEVARAYAAATRHTPPGQEPS